LQGRAPDAAISAAAAATPAESDALRGFPATPELVLQIAPLFRDFAGTARPSEAQIMDAAFHVRARLGIHLSAWVEAKNRLGGWAAAVALATVVEKHERGGVRSPGGYLRELTERHAAGDLRLDKTLWGIVDRLQGAGAAAAPIAALRRSRSRPRPAPTARGSRRGPPD
jgi:replication initiation protein RepC